MSAARCCVATVSSPGNYSCPKGTADVSPGLPGTGYPGNRIPRHEPQRGSGRIAGGVELGTVPALPPPVRNSVGFSMLRWNGTLGRPRAAAYPRLTFETPLGIGVKLREYLL